MDGRCKKFKADVYLKERNQWFTSEATKKSKEIKIETEKVNYEIKITPMGLCIKKISHNGGDVRFAIETAYGNGDEIYIE